MERAHGIVLSQVIGSHCFTALLVNYPGSLPFPKGWSLLCSFSFVRFSYLLSPDEPWRAYHILGLIQVCLQADPLNILTIVVSAVYTQIGYLPDICPSSV